MPGLRLDGNNVLEVYQATRDAVERARRQEGPTLLEYRTYRWLEHVGPYQDTHLGYRSEEEVKEWMGRCPIKTLENRLLEEKVLSLQKIQQWRSGLGKEIEEAVNFAKESPFPSVEALEEGVYSE